MDHTVILGECNRYVKLRALKVSNYILSWSVKTMDDKLQKLISDKVSKIWNQLTDIKSQVVSGLRGEKLLPKSKLDQMVLDIADVVAKHGYPLKYQEDYNALRLALGENYFGLWEGYDVLDCFAHTDWTALRENRPKSLFSQAKDQAKAQVKKFLE